jgi:Glycosyl hydrolase family 26
VVTVKSRLTLVAAGLLAAGVAAVLSAGRPAASAGRAIAAPPARPAAAPGGPAASPATGATSPARSVLSAAATPAAWPISWATSAASPAASRARPAAPPARPAVSPTGHPQPSAAGLPFGLFQIVNNGQYSFPATPAYAIQYYAWNEPFQTADAQAAWNAGTEMFAELQTCGNPCNSSTSVPITGVINGTYDSYLAAFATEVAAFGHPVLLTFDHEMNGSWYPWGDTEITPTQWIEAWQHVTSLISSIAPNATWVWAPNIEPGAASVAPYWPGNGYPNPHVNIVGLDGYFGSPGATWANTFSQSVADVMAASGGAYPFIVSETGVASTDPNSVAQIDSLLAGARSAGAVAVMYFDCFSEWTLSPAEQSAFQEKLVNG